MMRKPFLSGVCIGLLFITSISSTNQDLNFKNADEDDGNWLSLGKILHRAKRQWWPWGTTSTTTTPSPESESGDISGQRQTRSTFPVSVTPSLLPTDDEDLTNSGSGETVGHEVWTHSYNSPRYYRISLMMKEPYNPAYEDTNSGPFRVFAESLTQSINLLYHDVPGDQISRVIKIQKVVPFTIRVFMDLETVGNHNTDEIKQRLVRQVNEFQRIGPYVVENDIIFNEFGECKSGEVSCKDGEQCIPHSARCDQTIDCADGSDEQGCESVLTTTKRIDYEVNEVSVGECGQGEFICDMTRCILASQKCDGNADCQDGTDEDDCPQPGCDFRCGDGTCISYPQRCNIVKDCPDGDDERDCHNAIPPSSQRCPPGDYACRNGQCISEVYRCDEVADCTDKSDEEDCREKPCNGFTCSDGSCVELQHRCDGKIDCNDGTDEEKCPNIPRPTVPICIAGQSQCRDGKGCYFYNQTCDGRFDCPDGTDESGCDCKSHEYKCRSGDCIETDRVCDKYKDCPSGDDEENCESRECPSDKFRCADGRCISNTAQCDGYQDCPNGEDEENCYTYKKEDGETPCLDAEFMCKNKECIQEYYVCDGLMDCSDGSDERNCSGVCGSRDHRCKNGTCVKESKVCDSYLDCEDGSDEENCNDECKWTEFKCDTGECIPNIDRCNSRPDCQDGSDEFECPTSVECSSFQFKCSSDDQCIHQNLFCDGKVDCRDGSDERNCPTTGNDSVPGRCGPSEFKCLSGNQCIDRNQFCDGQPDCIDRSDEENCNSGPTLNLKTYPTEQTIKESREVVFQCRDEGPGHIPVKWSRGDGLPLPPNSRDYRGRLEMPNIQLSHSGTYYCEAMGVPRNSYGAKVPVYLKVEPFTVPTPYTPVCRQDQATCHNRECIPKNKVCDGHHDCGDGSDESRCSSYGCEPNEFTCDNKKCVRKSWVCDKDDDCGDGSDEMDCQRKSSGSLCYINEFECTDRKMCIPKWFHCDSHNDCHDGSDEIGCYPIKIVKVSQSMIVLNQGETLKITCEATGVPTPIISWRLNWHHVPSKCYTTSERGIGTLTCPDMQVQDQGAYTCEALDFRNSILAPDTHVVVTPLGPTTCPSGTFNSQASSPKECIPCFCFGATTDCDSSDQLYLHTSRPSILVARFINVRFDPHRSTVEVRPNDPSIIPQSAVRVSQDSVIQVATTLSNRRSLDQTYPYLAFPESLHGNQLKSYGGSIQYRVSFGGTVSQVTKTTCPDIILIGNGYTMYYIDTQRLSPSGNEMSIRLLPENWRIVEEPGRSRSNQLVRREDLMMALQNVENILVKFQYLEGENLDTTISDIRMDTASVRNMGQGVAVLVEQCRCPAGYSGQSCESCAPGYMRTDMRRPGGLWLGRCERYVPRTCPPGTYGDPARRIPCKPCPCPLTTPSNQFGLTCILASDGQPTCDCPAAYSGRRCEVCANGYTGNPMEPNGYCEPVREEQCNSAGSYSPYPDPSTGVCDCKAHTTGDRCDQCKPDTFALSDRHQHGCIDCFCMGITEECSSSNMYRDQIKAVFNSGSHGFMIAAYDDLRNQRNASFDSGRWEIMYKNFEPKVYYWVVPARFLGDKVTSYGGSLKYTLRYIPTPGGQSSRNNAPDVEIRSLNNINLVHRSQSTPEPGVESTITVPFLEQHWTREDGGPVDRPHLLMTLADLSAIYIKATYTTNTLEAGLMSVAIDTASYRNTGSQSRAIEVEQCRCPAGYIGTSCEDCDAGYTRTEDGLYLRFCEPCTCNNHTDQCHPETGVCENCGDNTAGSRCENCKPGFTRTSDGSCRYDGEPCDCDERGITGPCGSSQYCLCKVNVIDLRCDRCRSGTFGLTESRPEGCFECYCSGLTNQCQSSNLYREKIPTLVIDDNHGFTIFATPFSRTTSLRDGTVIQDNFSLDYSRNEVGFTIGRRSSQRYFWSLPPQLTGDKVASYGGKLSFKLRYEGSRDIIEMEPDTHIILVGNGITLFRHFSDDVIQAGYSKLFEVQLIDDGHWKIMNPTSSKTEASRIDMLKTLSSLEKILVLATFGDGIEKTHISDVAMDTAVPARLGQEASEVEVCRCPPEYKGTSCQLCNDHYYRNYDQTCRQCPCNGNDESCSITSNNQVRCNCRPGYHGQYCENKGYTDPIPVVKPDPPTIVITIKEPTIKIVEVGQTVKYNCTAISRLHGQQRLKTNWHKEGSQLPSRAIKEHGLLIITDVRESDSGVYVCTAFDGYRTESLPVTLTVGGDTGFEPSVRVSPEYVDGKIGDLLELVCEASGSPRPTISWRKQDGSLINPYSSQYEGVLRIDSLRREDEGVYECTATNGYGTDIGSTQVRLREPPPEKTLTITPWRTGGLEGDTVFLTCSSPRNIYRLSWSRQGGRPLPVTARDSNGTLTIFGARSADQGVYVCTAQELSTGRQVAEAEGRIEIGGNRQPVPLVTIDPDKQTVPQGNPASIRCVTTQPGVRVWWNKREDTIPPHIQIQGGTLRIPAVRVTDRGMYICTVEYGSGQVQKFAILEVEPREAPTIELYPRTQQKLVQGSSMLFQCRASGIPPPNIYWSRPGNRSIPFNIQQLPNGVLRLNNVQVSDAGQYVCHAENTAGSTTATANIEVFSTPVVKISPRGPITLQSGQILKLECNASGYPQPYVSWSRHRAASQRFLGSGMPDGLTEPSYNHAVYDVYSVTAEDEGLYLCNAKNDAGTTEERVEVIVNDNNVRPNPPDYEDRPQPTDDNSVLTMVGGESTQITCAFTPSQNDRMKAEWIKEGSRELPEGFHQKNGILYVNNVNKNGEGVYTCMLINIDTGAVLKQNKLTLTVNYPPRITLTPPRQVVRVGDNARIQCSAQGDQPITISWEAVDRPMPPSVTTQQGYLLFQGIRISDAGRYVCKARNSLAESSAAAEVIVNENTRPIVTAIDRAPSVLEGTKVELQCSADATLEMEWSRVPKDGRDGGANCCDLPPQASISGNSLILDYANPEDSGRYRCTGISPFGISAYDYIDLTVNRAQNIRLSIQPSIDVIRLGQTFDLRCIPSGVPNSQISWTKVGGRLANNVQVLENILRISDVTSKNNGIYRCSARTSTRHHEVDYILDVLVDDEFDGPSTNGNDNRYDNNGNGDDYDFNNNNNENGYDKSNGNNDNDYDNNGNDDDDDDDDNGYENGNNGYDNNNNRYDNNNNRHDNNNNEYNGNNGYDNGDDDMYDENADDKNEIPALDIKSADAGKQISLSCKTDIEQPVSYSWSKLGQELSGNTYADQNTLTISNLGEKDAGLYLCVASNGQVRMEIPTVVTVTGLIPSFHQNPISYVAMPMLLDAHLKFDIEITFKPEQPDGLILYNGQAKKDDKDGDFISFGLKSGRPEFRFEVGSGPAVITTNRPIRLNQWHTVRLTRDKRDGEMWIDGDGPHKGTSPGKYQGLDLDQPLYLGSVPEFDKINPMNGFSSGFVGCISKLKIGEEDKPMTREYFQDKEGVGDCDTCRDHACENGGACQQAHNRRGYVCLCPRGFSDENCSKLGESCYEGACGEGECVEADRGIRCKCPIDKTGDRCENHNKIKTPQFSSNSYIAYNINKPQQRLKITVMFKAADDSDGLLLYSSPQGTSHFVSLAVRNKHLEYLYDNGYGLSQVRSTHEISPGEWEVATISADDKEMYLSFHENNKNTLSTRPGAQRTVLGSLLYLGGVDPSIRVHPSVAVRKGFNGCVSSIDVFSQSLNIIWSAKEASGITECSARESGSSVSCRPNTCKNNGDCSIRNNRVTCACRPGYSGPYCETEEDECTTSSPCQNGGTCQKYHNKVQCICPPGIAGSTCEHRLEQDVSFNGDGYLELDTDLMPHDDPSDNEVIVIEFTTTSSNGLLLWQGQEPDYKDNSDFLAVAIVDGDIEVSYELGSGPARFRINDGTRVDDGKRHKVSFSRTASDGEVTLDSIHEGSGSSEGVLSTLNTPGNIFIGGAPDISETTGGRYTEGFKGCIHLLRLPMRGVIDLQMQPLRSLNALPCSNENNNDLIDDKEEDNKRSFFDLW